MPGKVKVKIISGRNLPVMDRSSDTTDAYVEIKLGTTTYKTDVCRKSLHPQWNSEWYRFEMDDSELQDEPLQIRLMDHDTYSANDAIGKVYLDLNPLLLPATSLLGKWNDGGNSSHEGNNSVMSGWIPVYDTMHGIRGEVNIIVKVELFSDFNKFRQSSCGVHFFCSQAIPHGFYAQIVHGFVEELVVNDDPEYQWIDKIRTPRASNEARQTLFFKLSGELQRKIGLKALDLGGNSVIGYSQCFDLEGESGIVARGIGTAVTLVKIMDVPSPNVDTNLNEERAQNYLNFLGSAKGFYLNNESNQYIDTSQYPYSIPSPAASLRSLKLEERIVKPSPRHLTRHMSDREFNFPVPIDKIHHSVSLQTLLKQEDMRGRTGRPGISQRFKNLKYTSQNMLSRKMTALKLKAKLVTDANDFDEVEPQKRILLKYRRTQSDSTGMAEILVRSVFHATTSLDCIAESPKISISESETKDSSFLSLPSPMLEGAASSNVSCTDSSSSASDDDEEEDDEEEDAENADTIDELEELDTVSHIVETVRKLSMVQPQILKPEPEVVLDFDESKFIFVVGDVDDDHQKVAYELLEEEPALLYYDEPDADTNLNVSLLHGKLMKKSSSAKSLTEIETQQLDASKSLSLNKKFVSLHNIHDALAKMNKYSAHSGKDTVLGELFKRIDKSHPQSHPEINTIASVEREHVVARDDSPKADDEQKHGILYKLREGGEMILHAPKELYHRLDSRIHHHNVECPKAQEDGHGLVGTAHGNVLMESVNENLATCQQEPTTNATPSEHNEKQNVETSGELKRAKPPNLFLPCQDTMPGSTRETKSLTPEEHAREGNVKIKAPHSAGFLSKNVKKALHKLDMKFHGRDDHSDKNKDKEHEKEKSGIKNEHGLLNIALGNVLMDSVQEVLATSHSDSPNSVSAPVFPSPDAETSSSQKSDQIEHNEVEDEKKLVGELFRRIDNIEVQSGPVQSEVTCEESNVHEASLEPHLLEVEHENHDEEKHGLLYKLKEGKDMILHAPKELYLRLDSKIHHEHEHEHDKSRIKNEHGLLNIALGNVLMDSVQEVLATSHSDSPNSVSAPVFPSQDAEACPDPEKNDQIEHDEVGNEKKLVGELFRRVDNSQSQSVPVHSEVTCEDSAKASLEPNLPEVEHESLDEEKHGLLYKLKEGKDMILHAPKELYRRLDSKIHHEHEHHDKSRIKHEHGLLNIALANVLMDSVQEVLATSHSESPSSLPETPSPPPAPLDTQHASHANLILPSTSNTVTVAQVENKQNDNSQNTKCLNTSQTSSQTHLMNELATNADHTVNTKVDEGNSDCINTVHACLTNLRNVDTPPADTRTETGHQRTESLGVRISHSPAKLNAIPCIHRRSSDSDLSITPKGNSLTGSDRSGGYSSGQCMRSAMIRTTVPQENFDIMEYPFLTMSKYPPGFIAFLGGSVSARSVKLLERISNIEEPESRDTWWSEIRMEIRSHARSLNCNAVLGYTETTSICDDVCVLSASGTAAVIGYQYAGEAADNLSGLPVLPKTNNTAMTTSLDRNDFEKDKQRSERDVNANGGTSKTITRNPNLNAISNSNSSPEREKDSSLKAACTICHLPYFANVKPLRSSAVTCLICGAFKVPDMLIATIELPEGIPCIGRGCFVQSYVCRPLKDLKGETNAKEISDGLPFLEYELHRFLINKLKVKGMNAIFGLKVRISIGERMLIGIATGTAVFLSPLPPPLLPKLVSDRTTDEKKLTQLQRNLHDTIKKNREIYQLRSIEEVTNGVSGSGKLLSDTDDSEEEQATLDLSMGNKDCCILEVDDPDDVDVLNSLLEPRPPDGFHVVNTEQVPGLEDLEIVKNLQMFTQIWRAKIPPPFNLDKHFHRLLQSVYFKLRRMIPCALCDLQFRVDSPEPDEIQLCVLGMALGLGDPFKNPKLKRKIVLPKRTDDDMIFNLEEDQIPEHSVAQTPPTAHYLHAQSLKHRQKSPIRNRILTKQRHVPYRERHGVDITPLSYVPGGKIEKYLGNLNFFLIRETTSLREEGGLSGFVHSFVTEILAIVRAHVTALGGNAMVAYFITECVLNHNLHKNQGQCLINVGGDVVYVTYFTEDH